MLLTNNKSNMLKEFKIPDGLIAVFGTSHSISLQEWTKSINRLTQINPTGWES